MLFLVTMVKQTIGDQHLTEVEKNNATIISESAKKPRFLSRQ